MSVLAFILLFIVPFVQIGVSYYASIATLGIFLLFVSRGSGLIRALTNSAIPKIVGVAAMSFSFLIVGGVSSVDAFRVLREVTLYYLLASILFSPSISLSSHEVRRLVQVGLGLAAALASVVVVQSYYYSQHTYFGLPIDWFVQNSETLTESRWALFYRVGRPSGTFGEPSYLGFVCASLMFIFSPLLASSKHIKQLFVLCFFATILARTAFGLIMIVAISGAAIASISDLNKGSRSVVLFAGVVGSIVILAFTGTFDRVMDITSYSKEASGFERLVAPILIMPSFLSEHPFGLEFSRLYSQELVPGFQLTWADITHNGLSNLIFEFGWLGFVAIIVLWSACQSPAVVVYVFLSAMQNGAFLSIDKVLIISVGCIGYCSLKRYVEIEKSKASKS